MSFIENIQVAILEEENDVLRGRIAILNSELTEVKLQRARTQAERQMLNDQLSAQLVVNKTQTDEIVKLRNRIAELTLGT